MKTLTLLTIALGLTFTTYGNVPKNYQATSKEGKIKVVQNGETVEKNIKVVLTKEQQIEFDHRQKYLVNQDIIASPVKVTKLILLGDVNSDTYSEALEIEYYTAPQLNMDYTPYDYDVIKYIDNGVLNTDILETNKVRGNKMIHGILKVTGDIKLNSENQIVGLE